MTPTAASRAARQLAALLHYAHADTGDLGDTDALDRAHTLLELALPLADALEAHLGDVEVAAARARVVDGEAAAS